MSTATATLPRAARATSAAPGLGRLTRVELRKMTDTRAGLWLLLGVAAAIVATVVISAFGGNPQHTTLHNILSDSSQPTNILLPIVGILLITSEWSQRTALQTFTLVPDRGRVLVAKVLAGVVLAIAAFAVCVVLSVAATAAAGPGPDAWSLDAGVVAQIGLFVVIGMLIGLAFGLALLASAPAIVLYFALPSAIGALTSLHALHGVGKWIDQDTSLQPMLDGGLSATGWAHVATMLALQLALPAAIGAWRVRRAEIG